MASITNTGRNKWQATFNHRSLLITKDNEFSAVDTATSEVIDGAELRSVRGLLDWHIESKRSHSELVTLWTTK